MNRAQVLVLGGFALLLVSIAVSRVRDLDMYLPRAGRDRHDHVHHSYMHDVLHMLHLEGRLGSHGGDPSNPLEDAFAQLDEALAAEEVVQNLAAPSQHLPAQMESLSQPDMAADTAASEAQSHSAPLQQPVYHQPTISALTVGFDGGHQPNLSASVLSRGEGESLLVPPEGHSTTDEEQQLRVDGSAGQGLPKVKPNADPAGRQSAVSSKQSPVAAPLHSIVTKQQQSSAQSIPNAAVAGGKHEEKKKAPQGKADCSGFGVLQRGRCECTRLRAGPNCEGHKDLSGFKLLHKVQRDFKGAITMSKTGLAGKKSLKVFLPGKEHEKDGGNRVLGRVTSGLLNAVEENDIFSHKVFEKCAVVGSSGILHHFQFGEEIDDHDMVLRFNSAPTRGFEKLVGSKTTHRITNTQNWCFRESDKEHILVHMRSTASLTAVIRTHMVRGRAHAGL
mmetsp:Transcript_29004/g.81691  ORF Transcript_29004/g.81691 Transcript_29004/m.81691 type:complete len:447 (+) Transcript_29004:194-1534(+)